MRLICMRLADMNRVHPKQDNSRVCAKCGEVVGVFPSGQAHLRRYPKTELVCERCHGPVDADARPLPRTEVELFETVHRKH